MDEEKAEPQTRFVGEIRGLRSSWRYVGRRWMSVRERMMGYDSRTGHRNKVSPSEILGGVSFPLLRRPD